MRRGRLRVQWDPGAERLAILPRGQAFVLVYDAASRAVTRVPTGRFVRPTLAPFSSAMHAARFGCLWTQRAGLRASLRGF